MLNEGSPRVVRRGRAAWLTRPPRGTARISVESHALGATPVSVPEHDPVPYEATPGELLAITHAMFMAWALSHALSNAGAPANELVVAAECTFAGELSERRLVGVDLEVSGRVPGLNPATFEHAVAVARRRGLLSAGAREDIPGEVTATLK
jgi:organic hydroperoxide reductase OsmC/OhrA